jgi:hypothetical protein
LPGGAARHVIVEDLGVGAGENGHDQGDDQDEVAQLH